MAGFNSLKDLYAYIEKSIELSLPKIGLTVKQIIEKYVQSEVYSQPEGSYHRTMDLLNNIEVIDVKSDKNGKYDIEIGWNWSNIQSHTTVFGGSTFGYNAGDKIPVALVAYSLEHGDTWNRNETNFLELTHEELIYTNIHIEALKSELKNNGFLVR